MFKKLLPIIFLTFVNIIGFTLLIPVLPAVISKYADPSSASFLYGALISSYAFFQFLGAPLLGSLSDRYGRKPLLLISQLGTTLSWVIFALAYFFDGQSLFGIALPILIIAFSRVVDGITGGNISVANAWISDVTDRSEKTKAFGLIGATFGVGFLFGPAIGGLTSSTSIGFLGTAIVAFILSVITLALIYFKLPESLPETKHSKHLKLNILDEINVVKKFNQFSKNSFLKHLLWIRIFFAVVFASYTTIIVLFLQKNFNLSPTGLGLTLSLIGIFSIFNQAVLSHKLTQKYGEINVLYISLTALFIGLVLIPFIPNHLVFNSINLSFILFMINSYILNLGVSLGMPTFKTLLTHNTPDDKQGAITGLDESLLALGNAITPIIAGSLYAIFNVKTFYIFAIILLIPHVVIYMTTNKVFVTQPKH